MDKTVFTNELKNFLFKKSPEKEGLDINGDTNLIYEGLLDSFSVVELVIHIEKITNKKLEIDKINSKSIETLNNIYTYFIENSN